MWFEGVDIEKVSLSSCCRTAASSGTGWEATKPTQAANKVTTEDRISPARKSETDTRDMEYVKVSKVFFNNVQLNSNSCREDSI